MKICKAPNGVMYVQIIGLYVNFRLPSVEDDASPFYDIHPSQSELHNWYECCFRTPACTRNPRNPVPSVPAQTQNLGFDGVDLSIFRVQVTITALLACELRYVRTDGKANKGNECENYFAVELKSLVRFKKLGRSCM